MVVTHEMQFAKEVAHQVIFLDNGIVTEQGPAYELLTNPQSDRLRIFLSRLQIIRNTSTSLGTSS